jgi:pilus assembly protein FimV
MACAVGFGGINVTSSLGQPLVAEIELVAVEKTDKSSLTARLASPEAFKGAGIDYPYGLPKLKFHVETRANVEAYIKATSDQPVNEPFVSLLIELGWPSGRLLREYTFLLDPPGFVAEQPVAVAVKPIEPVVVAPVIASVPVPASAPQA